MADREGRLECRPKKIKAEVLPYDNCNIENLIEELTARSFVTIYSINNENYMEVSNFNRHQHCHVNEAPSSIPAPEEHGASTIPEPEKHSASTIPEPEKHSASTLQKRPDTESLTLKCAETSSTELGPDSKTSSTVPAPEEHRTGTVQKRLDTDSLLLIPDSLTLISAPRCEHGASKVQKRLDTGSHLLKSSRQCGNRSFSDFWDAYPKKRSKGQAEKAFLKINPDEQLLAIMIATIERAKTSEDWCKEGGRFIPHPATWLNNRRWEDEDVETHPLSGKVSDLTLRNLKVLENWRPDNGK